MNNPSAVAQAVNFLRSGCPAVQFITNLSWNSVEGPQSVVLPKRIAEIAEIFDALKRPGENFSVDAEGSQNKIQEDPDRTEDIDVVITATREIME